MPNSTLAGIITASASVLTAISLLVTAFTVLVPILRGTKDNAEKISEVHVIVNQQRTDAKRYQRELIQTLKDAGVAVPRDQSEDDA